MHERNNVFECHAKPCLVCKDDLAEYLLNDLGLPQLSTLAFTAELGEGPHITQVLAQALRKLDHNM
jgi:hypothetical protein